MRRVMVELWRYTRIAAILFGVGFGVSAFLWVPLSLGLIFWFGGSAVSAVQMGRTDALVAHGVWTKVSAPVFYAVFYSEVLAIASILTFLVSLMVMWIFRRGDEA